MLPYKTIQLFLQEGCNKTKHFWIWSLDYGSVYTGPDPFGTGTKLTRISLAFTRDLLDPVRIGSAIWYQMGPLMKVIPYGTVSFQFQTGPVSTEWIRTMVDPIPKGSKHI